MTLPSGLYIVGVAGMFATDNGVDGVITVAPHVPPFLEHQIWDIQAVEGKEGIYTIVRPLAGSWYPTSNLPGSPIITSKDFEWHIAHVDNGVPGGAYTIRSTATLIGSFLYAGTNDENQVVIKVVPVVPRGEAPQWEFKRLLEE